MTAHYIQDVPCNQGIEWGKRRENRSVAARQTDCYGETPRRENDGSMTRTSAKRRQAGKQEV